jgi:flavin reductase (DIM6/NTAB) family NADH-FMN oxidoreductase RutF
MSESAAPMRGREPGIDARHFRSVMGRFATGVTVVTTALEGRVQCMTANAFMSGSLEPPLCVISVAKKARLHDALARSRHFAVNILGEDQQKYSLHFAGRPVEGLEASFDYVDETPLLVGRIAAIAAQVTAIHPCGDHSLFVGAIFHMSALEHGKPLVFHRGHYAALAHPARLDHLPTPEFW